LTLDLLNVTVTIMSIPLFHAPTEYVNGLTLENPITIEELCKLAGVTCRASGAWIQRLIEVRIGKENRVFAEPGDWGRVRIEVKFCRSKEEKFRQALSTMAYGLHDLVARESIKGQPWNTVTSPKGRPRTGKALTTAERQRKFRLITV